MLIKKAPDIRSSEITPKSVYLKRREFIQAGSAALAGAGIVAAGWNAWSGDALAQGGGLPKLPNVKKSPLSTTEAPSAYEYITSYNNFYEFAPGAGDGPKKNSGKFKATPWTIEVDGLCNKPGKYNLEDFIKPFALEERIYRFRCVEAWSFVIPWVGIPLSEFIKRAEPQGKARIHRDDHAGRSGPLPDAEYRPSRVALQGRAAPRRGQPSPDDSGGRPLRRSAPGAERRAAPPDRAVEVRVQGGQVDRQDAVRRQAADQHLAGDGAQ
jgi:sulfoxide reductase catalytic subunit YedY